MIVALGSVRGSPGVSAWTMILAAAWPGEGALERVVVEADVDGGVAGARYGVGVDPGVLGLVTGLRRGGDPSAALWSVGRRLSTEAWLVPGPESAEMSHRVWSADRAAATAASAMAKDPRRVWLCDVGRVGAGSVVAPVVASSVTTLLFSRDAPADLVQVPARIAALREVGSRVGVVVVGEPSYGRDQLADFFGDIDVWIVPHEARVIEMSQRAWSPSSRSARWLRQADLWRLAVEIAADLADIVSTASGCTASLNVAGGRRG